MARRIILICICIVFLGGSALFVSSSYVRGRIRAHVDSWLGRKTLAENIIVTIPEGSTNVQIAELLAQKIPHFDRNLFLAKATGLEGYLFPDTYFFWKFSTIDETIETFQRTFDRKIVPLLSDAGSTDAKRSIIIMASVVQKEAQGKDDAATIAGILWKRAERGMPLQVDAAPVTYTASGLPSAPISNPGVVAVNAALHPLATEYFYYLHDKNGMIHFAKTYEEHRNNIAKYLK
jgi:UPF0755 protein